MPKITEEQRLAAEWLACADALRTSRAQLYRAIAAGSPAIVGNPQTSIALCDGLNVAIALEQLAEVIAPTEE
jgi:hypothetical protein